MRTYISTIFTFIFFINSFCQSITIDTIKISEVVITGTKIKVARKNVPLTVSVITKEEIEQSNETALLPIISEYVPGLFVTERGITGFGVANGAAGQINIRGLGGNPTTQVLILIDGHPQFMGLMGHHLPDSYVASDVERVEVIRGPGSILYGSNAFGGVINFITKKQQNDGLITNARVLYGSYNTQKYMANAGFRKKRFNVFGSINRDRTDGDRDSSDFQITNGYIKAGIDINDKLKINADLSLTQYGAADPGTESGNAGERINILRGKTALSVENNLKNAEGALKLYYNFGEHKITDGWRSNDEMYGLMIYQGLKLLNGNIMTLGFDYMNYGGKGSPIIIVLRDENGNIIPGPQGPQFILSNISDEWVFMSNQAVYSFIQQSLFNKLILNAGLRYEMNGTYGNELIPQIGFAYHPTDNSSFKGSISKGYRPPSIRELYLFPPGNDKLVPERMVNYEFGWIQNCFEYKMKFELTGFLIQGKNMIIKVPSSPPPPPQYKNTGEFTNKGIEFSLNYLPASALKFHTNYTYINMKNPLIATPEHNIFISGNFHYKKFNFNLKLQNIINLYGLNNKGTITVIEKGYSLLGLKIGYDTAKYFNVFINGNNLLNQKYQINYGYPMPGSTFFVGINFKFENK